MSANAGVGGSLLNLVPGVGPLASQGLNTIAPVSQPDVETLTAMFLRGLVSPGDYRTIMRTHGVSISQDNLGLNQSVEAYISTRIAPSGVIQLINDPLKSFNGTGIWNAKGFLNLPVPTLELLQTLMNRGLIDYNLARWYMRMDGWVDPNITDALLSLRNDIPPIQDIIRFSVRDCFTPVVVSRFGYQNELPDEMVKWANKLGFGGQTDIDRPAGVNFAGQPLQPGKATWADLFWWAHWELPSVGMANEMYHRLYPASRYGASPELIEWKKQTGQDIAFGLSDLQLQHRANNFPIYWRDRLIATAFNPLTRIDVRRMRILGVINKERTYHAYRAIGYNDENAELLTNFTEEQKRQADLKKQGLPSAKTVCKFYGIGMISAIQAADQMTKLGLTPAEVQSNLNSCDLDVQYNLLKESIGYIRHKFTTGDIEYSEAHTLLVHLGLAIERVEQYLKVWQLKTKGRLREVTLSQLARWFADRVIPEDDLVRRMQNLHYKDDDITRFLRQFRRARDIAEDKLGQKAIDAQSKIIRGQIEAAAKIIKANQKVREKNLKTLLAASTDTNLKAWYSAGLITADVIRARLFDKGWVKEDIDRWLQVEENKIKESQSNATKTPQANK